MAVMPRRVAKKDGTLTKTHVDTEVEQCSCSLTPSTVCERSVVHDFNSLIDTTTPFSAMLTTEYLLRHMWTEREQITERSWVTNMRTKREWEEIEAIRRIKLELI